MTTDDDFKTLLADYAAPVEEDGFSNAVMAALPADVLVKAASRWRGVVGGTVLAVGLALWALALRHVLGDVAFDPAVLADIPWLYAAVPVSGMALWFLLDPDLAV